jgi:murein DD-endopeptidase MepM/ murein hydrolase activator NlpD
LLKRLRQRYAHGRKASSQKKQEYFTIIILPGPNSRVRKYSFSKTLLRNAGLAVLSVGFVSMLMFGEYFHMKGLVWELDRLRTETATQGEQIRSFAGSLVDMKGQMAHIKELSDKLKGVAGLGAKNQQKLGIGGAPEVSSTSLDEFGRKSHQEILNQMNDELQNLKVDAAEQETSITKLTQYFEHKNSILACTPTIWPVRGLITSDFGYRQSPIYGTRQFHSGLDIANAIGTPIAAAANGTVMEAGYTPGYGLCVKIQHGYGIVSLYGHMSRIKVHAGQRVKKGEILGALGNTGSSTGPHLHYEVWVNGVPSNPKRYI